MKLPLWRVLAGFGVLGGLMAVLLSLAPLYLNDYQLRVYMKSLAAGPQAATEAQLRTEILARAKQLGLPVTEQQLTVSTAGGHRKLEAKYSVEKHLALYQVDLHFHPHAER